VTGLRFTYRIDIDGDYPMGAATRDALTSRTHDVYTLTVSAVGPVVSERDECGIIAPLTVTGTFTELDKIEDEHLRETAKGLAETIESGYLTVLADKRNQITAMIRNLGGQ
jgi:hypothetical protein